jgi:hypothetical protein
VDEAAAGSQTEEAVTREEKCRKVAEWLGYVAVDCRIEYHGPRCWRFNDQHILRLPDFYSDEAANALALDKFIEDAESPQVRALFDEIARHNLTGEQRRAAVVDHVTKLIESEGR